MKKNDKIKILLSILLITMIATWFIAGGNYDTEGTFQLGNITRGGIFDLILALMYSFYYKIHNVFFLFAVGGAYGVLSQTKSYRKLVDKTVNLVKGKENIFFLLTTFITALFVSLTSEVLVLFMFVPFIISIFLKCGKDRVTALSAAIGGIIIGIIGNTFGTYGVENMISAIGITYTKGIGFKIAFFIISYVLYNLFALLHMNKQQKELDETEYDLFLTEELDESKKKRKTKLWPTITMFILLIIVTILGYINWQTSFGIEFFNKLEKGFENLSVRGIPILYSLAGSTSAFGNWTDLMGATGILLVTVIIVSLFNKVKIDDFIDNFFEGMKKVVRVVMVFALVYTIFVIVSWYGWPVTVVNSLIGSGKFNIFTLFLASIVISFYLIENNYSGYILGTFITNSFGKKALAATLMLNSSFGTLAAILPTSFILMIGLTALDIPYKSWLKYIWKFVLAMVVVILIIISIMVYM